MFFNIETRTDVMNYYSEWLLCLYNLFIFSPALHQKSEINSSRIWLPDIKTCAIHKGMGNQSRAAYPLFFGGANPPDERKEGVADVCYIFGFNPDGNIHLRSCRIVLHNFQGNTKTAAITAIMTAVHNNG